MRGKFFSFLFITILASLTSCLTANKSTTITPSIDGKYWKLVELNGEKVQPGEQLKKEPHMILNASEKRVNGNGGCNSFFGSYDLQAGNGISFSKIGSTKMACAPDIMQVEYKLFQAFEMTGKYTVSNDSLFLMNKDMSTVAKFVASDMK